MTNDELETQQLRAQADRQREVFAKWSANSELWNQLLRALAHQMRDRLAGFPFSEAKLGRILDEFIPLFEQTEAESKRLSGDLWCSFGLDPAELDDD